MSTRPEEFFVQAWKQQLDTGLRIIESVLARPPHGQG